MKFTKAHGEGNMKGVRKSIKDMYEIRPIPFSYAKGWCLKRHYAKRIPTITEAFGLYNDSGIIVGVCTFGVSANYKEAEAWKPFKVWELNRLITEDNLQKNATSFFVSGCLKKIEKPKVLISYADLGMNHHGYIYQATNWIFTGISGEGQNIYITKNGRELHQRTVDIGDGGAYKKRLYEKGIIVKEKKTMGKARYYYFLGSKKEKKQMYKMLRYPILPYPKGDNERYDSDYKKSEFQLF
jgi:hypothetical protein